VRVVTNLGPVPQIEPRADLAVRLTRVAEFKAAKEAAQAKIAAKYGELYKDFLEGRYIAGDTYWQIKTARTELHKATKRATHKTRINALAKVAAEAQPHD